MPRCFRIDKGVVLIEMIFQFGKVIIPRKIFGKWTRTLINSKLFLIIKIITSYYNRARGPYRGIERLSLTFTANGKRQTFTVCLQLSVQQNQNICICSE